MEGEAKGKSMLLSWSGTKAVIKRRKPPSHILNPEWERFFFCTTLLFLNVLLLLFLTSLVRLLNVIVGLPLHPLNPTNFNPLLILNT